MSTWEPGAVSMVLLQKLNQLTSSVGGLLPQQLLDESAPLLTSCEELSAHLSPSWSLVWPVLLDHIQLLFQCGRSVSELAATFTSALVSASNPTEREKACLQLVSILQGKMDGSSQAVVSPSLVEDGDHPLTLEDETKEKHEEGQCTLCCRVSPCRS